MHPETGHGTPGGQAYYTGEDRGEEGENITSIFISPKERTPFSITLCHSRTKSMSNTVCASAEKSNSPQSGSVSKHLPKASCVEWLAAFQSCL